MEEVRGVVPRLSLESEGWRSVLFRLRGGRRAASGYFRLAGIYLPFPAAALATTNSAIV